MNAILRFIRPVDVESPLWPIARSYAWTIPVVVVLSLTATALEGVGISLLIPLMAMLITPGGFNYPGGVWSLFSRFMDASAPDRMLLLFGGTILGFVILKGIVQAINMSFIAWVDGRAGDDIRNALSKQLLTLGYPFFLREDPARLLSILSSEAWRTSDALRHRFNMVGNAASAVVFMTLLLIVNWKLTLVVAVGVFAIRSVQLRFVRRVQVMSGEVSASNLKLADQMMRTIDAMRPIRIFGQEAREHQTFAHSSGEVRRSMFGIDKLYAILLSVLEMSHAALFIGILLGAHMAGVSLPILLTFMVLLFRCQPCLRELSSAKLTMAQTEGSVKEVEWLLDAAGKPADPKGGRPFDRLTGPIAFDRVSYRYDTGDRDTPALRELSFEIRQGRTTALIGHSGSGKSTIVNLLCRLIEPTEGRILAGGVPLADVDIRGWRGRLGIAGQDIDLIDGSIRDNISYGDPAADFDAIVEAARLADIHAFISGLPEGYDTQVGARGLGLSGGQRQRIGMARAFVRKPDVLILDEATNAVDGLSEAAILELLRSKSWTTTTIVVSHRASTLAQCDDGIVIENGVLIEAGPLQQLEAYRQMMAASAISAR